MALRYSVAEPIVADVDGDGELEILVSSLDGFLHMIDERDIDEDGYQFSYHWDQHHFDPVSHHTICKIHFEFEDGSKLRNAFVYKWRLWTLPELHELLQEAGFDNVHVLWEQTGDDGRGSGVFKKVRRGDPTYSWVAFVVGQKPA